MSIIENRKPGIRLAVLSVIQAFPRQTGWHFRESEASVGASAEALADGYKAASADVDRNRGDRLEGAFAAA